MAAYTKQFKPFCEPLEGELDEEFFRRIRYLLNRRRFDRELAGDLEFIAKWLPVKTELLATHSTSARRRAKRGAGLDRPSLAGPSLCFRLLRKSPGFTLAAVLILSIGIGVNIAAFGFFNLMVLRPLPVRDPATLVRFQRLSPKGYASVLPYPEMAFFREHTTTLSAVWPGLPRRVRMQQEQVRLTPNL